MTELNEILDRLPEYMGKNETGNEYVLAPVVDELDNVDTDVDDVDLETNPKTATNIPSLAKLGALVDEKPGDSNFDQYRRDVLLRYAQNTSGSATKEIILALANLIDTDPKQVKYDEENSGTGTSVFTLPLAKVNEVDISTQGIADSMTDFCTAGYQIQILLSGTLEYATPTEYNNDNMDSSKGYDGLDSNGDPKGNGGTYGGIV